jgi:hypothetical protein
MIKKVRIIPDRQDIPEAAPTWGTGAQPMPGGAEEKFLHEKVNTKNRLAKLHQIH